MEEKKITKDRLLHMLVRALPMIIVLALLAGTALWINRPKEGETAADSSRMVYAPARVTAVLSDNAQEDFENAEGRRVGDQELEIRILSGDHKDEIMTVTNYMSALFNVDVQQGDRIIVRIMTDEDGSYYASVFNYDRGIVLGGFLLVFFILLAALGTAGSIACLLALPLALAACGVQNVPAQTAQPTDTPVETPAPTTASTAPVEEPAASSEPAPESTPAQGEQMPAAPDQAAQESELASYTQTLGCFFNTPLQSTKELPQDYYLSFFLLYQTFESKGEGSTYTQNDNYFWEIPDSDLLQTAAIYLGLSDLSISDITEWPFGEPQNGICYYSQETSLPYGDITVTNVKIDTATSKAQVFAEAGDTQFEDSTRQSMALVYHFTCTAGPDGRTVYRLESIAVQ